MAEQRYNKWVNYTLDIKTNIMKKVKQFAPTYVNFSGNKSFKLTKNHIPNFTFKKVDFGNINAKNDIHENVIHINPKKQITKAINSVDNKSSNLISQEKRTKTNVSSGMNKIDYQIKIDDKDIIMKDDITK